MSAPVISVQPQPYTLQAHGEAVFQVSASGDNGVLSYQWYKGTTALSGDAYYGVQTQYLTVYDVTAASEGSYWCRVSNASGHTDSDTAQLTLGFDLPRITLQPSSVVAAAGTSATFKVVAESTNGALSYKWYKGSTTTTGIAISGETYSTFTVPSMSAALANGYYCRIFNRSGSITTTLVTLSLPGQIGGGQGGSGGGTGIGILIGSSGTASMSNWQGPLRAVAGKGRWLRNGKFTEARPCGPPLFERPFEQWGDRLTAIWKQPYRQAIESMAALPEYSVHPDRGDYYLIRETAPEHRGAGIGVWDRWYCPVPQTHIEYEDFPFSFQYASGPTAMSSFTRTVTSEIKCEYFLARDRAAFPVLEKDEYSFLSFSDSNGTSAQLFKTGDNDLQFAPGTLLVVSSAPRIVAEPSKITTWNHPIMCRATRYVPGPTTANVGTLLQTVTTSGGFSFPGSTPSP